MVDWNAYFRKLMEWSKVPVVNDVNVNAPSNYAPPAIQNKIRKQRREEKRLIGD